MQNEMLEVMAMRVLRGIAALIQSEPLFTVMVDETTDVSNVEQVVLCFRCVDRKYSTQEEFVGYMRWHPLELRQSTLSLLMCFCGQILLFQRCVASATMSGARTGVAARICPVEPRVVFTHCYGHSLIHNLACCDAINECKVMKHALDTTHEITKLIKRSHTRDAMFKKLKEEMQGSDTPQVT